jgi:hypothetical protein
VKDEKIQAEMKRKMLVKEMSGVCEERMKGTNYDKYFCEAFCKKIKTSEEIESVINNL